MEKEKKENIWNQMKIKIQHITFSTIQLKQYFEAVLALKLPLLVKKNDFKSITLGSILENQKQKRLNEIEAKIGNSNNQIKNQRKDKKEKTTGKSINQNIHFFRRPVKLIKPRQSNLKSRQNYQHQEE